MDLVYILLIIMGLGAVAMLFIFCACFLAGACDKHIFKEETDEWNRTWGKDE